MKTSSLKKIPAAKAKRAAVRFGRPPKELAGEVDARILDAARKIFLERGFEGASIDEIAEVARSGKPTIYARFRDKRALFTAVVTRDILSRITEFKSEVPTGATIEERLTSAAITLVHWGFDSDRIALMRLGLRKRADSPIWQAPSAGRRVISALNSGSGCWANWRNRTSFRRCRPSPRSASRRRLGSSSILLPCPCCFGRCSR